MARRVTWKPRGGGPLPPNTKSVMRPTRWGNPYKIGRDTDDHAEAVALFRGYLREHPELVEAARRELAGYDLACVCQQGEVCHGELWLRIVAGEDP